MPNSNEVASVEMLWERVLSLLVVGASVLGGSAVLLIQVLPLSISTAQDATILLSTLGNPSVLVWFRLLPRIVI